MSYVMLVNYGNYTHKPDIKHFTETDAVFVDDSVEEYDVAILCTGYLYSFPFLKYRSSGVTTTVMSCHHVMPMYIYLININEPTMAFVGAGKHTLALVRDRQEAYMERLLKGTQIPCPAPVFTAIVNNHIHLWYPEFTTFRDSEFTILSDTEYRMVY